MNQRMMALTFGVGTLLLATQHAFGQTRNCAERAVIVARLEERYGETRHALGVSGTSSVLEVFASDETGTWTVLISLPDGRACMVASGEGYEATVAAAQPTGMPL